MGLPHVHGDGLDPRQLLFGQGQIEGIQTGLLAVVGDGFDRRPIEVEDQRDVAVPLGGRLLVHAEPGHDAARLGLLAPGHCPLHQVPGFVPTGPQQPGAAQDIRLEQDVDGVVFEGEGEPAAGQGPGEADLVEALLGAVHSGRAGMQPGHAFAVIEVPPLPGRQVIMERRSSATFWASEASIAAMRQPEIDLLFLGVKADAFDPPGVGESQESSEESDIAHGRDLLGGETDPSRDRCASLSEGTESLRLGRCCRANRPMSRSELPDQASDAESPTHLVIPVGERANDDFQIDRLAQREVGSTGRGEILHRVRTVLGGHVVRHQLQVLLQRPFRPPCHPPPEPQPSVPGGSPDASGPLGLRVLSGERPLYRSIHVATA